MRHSELTRPDCVGILPEIWLRADKCLPMFRSWNSIAVWRTKDEYATLREWTKGANA